MFGSLGKRERYPVGKYVSFQHSFATFDDRIDDGRCIRARRRGCFFCDCAELMRGV